ncbi:MAG: nucleotidyltransferase domain-containing protein [Candidatus Vogelbacteria bacterium]|nr:nucleotidyltransferase domain-containing protein [Candidatus Vogelbacteria bacterium]
MNKEILEKLKTYFENRDEVVMAFLFGSRAEGRARNDSDWDIGVYFRPKTKGELETKERYTGESEISGEVARLLGAETDVVVLNRARPSLVFDVLNSGKILANKDETLYLELLSKTHYEAVDYWNFVKEFWDIRQQAASLTPKARAFLAEHLTFLENEFADFPKFQNLSWKEYQENRSQRREIERWVENVVMSLIDIAKVILASEKKDVPQTYNETIKRFAISFTDEKAAEKLAEFAELRNLVVHEYLDLRFARIKRFIEEAETQLPPIIEKIKEIIK